MSSTTPPCQLVCLWVASVCCGSECLHTHAAQAGSWPQWRSFFSDIESQSDNNNALAIDALFLGVLSCGPLLWMSLHIMIYSLLGYYEWSTQFFHPKKTATQSFERLPRNRPENIEFIGGLYDVHSGESWFPNNNFEIWDTVFFAWKH